MAPRMLAALLAASVLRLVQLQRLSELLQTPAYFSVNFTGQELRLLSHLRPAYCAASANDLFRGLLFDPWFCVPRDFCTFPDDRVSFYDPSKPKFDCSEHVFNRGWDVCCPVNYITGLRPDTVVYGVRLLANRDDPDLTASGVGTSFINYYMDRVFHYTVADLAQKEVKGSICALVPTSLKDGLVHYTPMTCLDKALCDRQMTKYKDRINELVWDKYYVSSKVRSSRFCPEVKDRDPETCCHPAVSLPNVEVALNWTVWEFSTLNPPVPGFSYPVGFRSSLMCEQYSKLSCEDKNETCPGPTNKYPKSQAWEFPTLAYVGIKGGRLQYFFCAGTIVSRLFVLSVWACLEYEGEPASVILTGDYNFWETNEDGSNETFSYIINSIVQPDAWLTKDINTLHESTRVVLFELWRPLTFHQFKRPACINTGLYYPETQPLPYSDAWFAGIGPETYGGRWSQYPKKTEIDLTHNLASDCGYGSKWNSTYHMCLFKNASRSQKIWGPCEFDYGAQLVTDSHNYREDSFTVPYCQTLLYAVAATVPDGDCTVDKGYVFRKITGELISWIEDKIYRDDFFLPDLDLSWPKCKQVSGFYANRTYPYKNLLRAYDQFYVNYSNLPY